MAVGQSTAAPPAQRQVRNPGRPRLRARPRPRQMPVTQPVTFQFLPPAFWELIEDAGTLNTERKRLSNLWPRKSFLSDNQGRSTSRNTFDFKLCDRSSLTRKAESPNSIIHLINNPLCLWSSIKGKHFAMIAERQPLNGNESGIQLES